MSGGSFSTWHSISLRPLQPQMCMLLQLNALACKATGKGTLSGEVTLNGHSYRDRDFRHWGVYVMQAEPMLNTATVSRQSAPHAKQTDTSTGIMNNESLPAHWHLTGGLKSTCFGCVKAIRTRRIGCHSGTCWECRRARASGDCHERKRVLRSGEWVQVKETIMTSALLQLPLSMPYREKRARVDEIICQLVRACCPLDSPAKQSTLVRCT
jgi:hypothetical protein